jgi:hypothetical protein
MSDETTTARSGVLQRTAPELARVDMAGTKTREDR